MTMTDLINDGWLAHVERDMLSFGVRILLGHRIGDGMLYVTRIGTDGFGGYETERVEQGHEPSPAVNLRIPEDAARALYDALAAHFAGEAGSRQTRADLVHERGRVDKLIATLSTIATKEHA